MLFAGRRLILFYLGCSQIKLTHYYRLFVCDGGSMCKHDLHRSRLNIGADNKITLEMFKCSSVGLFLVAQIKLGTYLLSLRYLTAYIREVDAKLFRFKMIIIHRGSRNISVFFITSIFTEYTAKELF